MTRSIIITGANNGIGLTLTLCLLDLGDRVAASTFRWKTFLETRTCSRLSAT
jgi:NAD(P)-dependent dehydrogenase (short-subunit alcohol dehydrogenase family)